MAKNIIEGPCNPIATPPAGNKGGPGVYNGDDQAPFSSHRRTTSSDGVPEKLYDSAIPSGGHELITPNQLPKHMK